VARNTLAAERRRAAREVRLARRIAGRRLLDHDDVSHMEERLDADRPARQAIQALAGLPGSERAVLELVAVDQLTVGEEAAALGTCQGTARVRLHALNGVVTRPGRPGDLVIKTAFLGQFQRPEAALSAT
jgi:RNA polymerase sigma-70 factor (ECF subfamily)